MDTQAPTELEQLRAEVAELKQQLKQQNQLEQPQSLPALRDNFEFVLDFCRFSEQLEGYSENFLRRKWNFTEETWEQLGNDDELVRIIEKEKLRRVRDGSFKREKAQALIIKGPKILDDIMTSPKSNDRHKVDAIKALNSIAEPSAQAAHNDADRVIIQINLGADEKLVFGGPIKPDPNPTIDVTPAPVPGFAISE